MNNPYKFLITLIVSPAVCILFSLIALLLDFWNSDYVVPFIGLLGLVTGFYAGYKMLISREENTNLEEYISKYTSNFMAEIIGKYIPALFVGAIIGVTLGFIYITLGSLLIIFLYYTQGMAFR